jgi:hypothetical protein
MNKIKHKTGERKGQMKIQQTAFLLLAVTLLFAMVGIFVVGLKMSDLKKSAMILEEKNAVLLVSKLANSPEFACGNAYGINRINCVDADKAMMLRENLTKYRRFWGVKNIEIRKIYPSLNEEIECTRDTYPECNLIRIWPRVQGEDYVLVDNFVSLCRKEPKTNWAWDKCEMAILMVDYEREEW